jgi:hypothetical protein
LVCVAHSFISQHPTHANWASVPLL